MIMFAIEHPDAAAFLIILVAASGSILTVLLFEFIVYLRCCAKRAIHFYEKVRYLKGYNVVREAEKVALHAMNAQKVED